MWFQLAGIRDANDRGQQIPSNIPRSDNGIPDVVGLPLARRDDDPAREQRFEHRTRVRDVPTQRVGRWPECKLIVDTLSRLLYARHGDRQLSARRVAGALRDRQESEGAAGPAQTLQKGDGRAPCCDRSLRPEHAGLECAPIEGQSRGPARDGRQWPLAHHVPLGRQGRPRAGSRAVSLNGRRRRW
jgi:hypothetical protein